MSSRFRGILDSAKGKRDEQDAPQAEASGPAADAPADLAPTPMPPPALPAEAAPPRGPGRPRGKRSDPGYDQVSAYIPHALHQRVRMALLQDDRGQEFSELVTVLLVEWLDRRGPG